MVPGTNKTLWDTRSLPNGRYWLCLSITRHGSTVSNTARGVVVVSHRAGRPAAPVAATVAPRAVRNGGRVDVTFTGSAGAVAGYEVQDAANGTSTLVAATSRTTYVKCHTRSWVAHARVRAYGPGGLSGWSPLSAVVGC